MNQDEALAHRLAEILCAARRAARAWWVSDKLIDAVAPRVIPLQRLLTREVVIDLIANDDVLRDLVREAVADQTPPMCPTHQIPGADGKPIPTPRLSCVGCAIWVAR